ncbi:MAG: hypothetical protein IKD37_08815 [Clostridia bacterium]|nr:hypothetical protein [Clostridia bacterium]
MAKQHPADREVDRLIEIQREAAPATRRRDIVLIALCAALILTFAVGIYLLPQRSFSAQENRALQPFPKVSFARIWDGRFMAELKDFYTDQFPLRDILVPVKAGAELALGKGENNDVILGREGYLVKRIEYSEAQLDTVCTNLDAIDRFSALSPYPVSLAIAPRAIDVLGEYLPGLASADRAAAVWPRIDSRSGGMQTLSLREVLTPLADAGEPVWYRTDHHWTTLGAYHAYAAIGGLCGYTPTPLDRFTPETAAGDFLGTTYSASGFGWIEGEEMQFYRYPGDENFTVEVLLGGEVSRTLDGFYDRSYLEKKDKYAAFLSSNNGHMRIRADGEDRPTMLLIKDSFAHAVVPFLAQHYDLEILDLRYYRGSVAKFLAAAEIDQILILVGLDTLATDATLTGLTVGME